MTTVKELIIKLMEYPMDAEIRAKNSNKGLIQGGYIDLVAIERGKLDEKN